MERLGLTAANLDRRSRRWLQFSLRGFLVVLTIGCLWLGWKVEKARRRGRAIDAIAVEGCWVTYRNIPFFYPPDVNHFWQDFTGVPVSIALTLEFSPTREVGFHLSDVDGIAELDLTELGEDDLQRIPAFDAEEVIVFYSTTTEGVELLRRKALHCKIVKAYRKPAL